MVTITLFQKPKDSFSYAPQKFSAADGNDVSVDVYEDGGGGGDFDSRAKLTFPGLIFIQSRQPVTEPILSAKVSGYGH